MLRIMTNASMKDPIRFDNVVFMKQSSRLR